MRWFWPIALALMLTDGVRAESSGPVEQVGGVRRGLFSWFAGPGREIQPVDALLAPQDVRRIMREDHRRAEALLEHDRAELRRSYRDLRDQRVTAWEIRWAIRDEAMARQAKERARERRQAEISAAPGLESVVSGESGLVRRLLDRPAVQDAGQAVGAVVRQASDTVQSRVLRPMEAHARRMPPGHFALLLAGTFFVPSLGVASLILGFASLRVRYLRRSAFFFALAGLCGVAVAAALRFPHL